MGGQEGPAGMRLRGEEVVYGLGAAIVAAAVFALVESRTSWPFYGAWLAALGAATFVVYGADKLSAVAGCRRAPEPMLNALAVLGGFAGAWVGMLLFRHKSNRRKHPTIWLALMASSVIHAVIGVILLARA